LDPVRAAEIYEQVTERWWKRYMLYREVKGSADKELIDKLNGSTS
jgi:hypothetical protein